MAPVRSGVRSRPPSEGGTGDEGRVDHCWKKMQELIEKVCREIPISDKRNAKCLTSAGEYYTRCNDGEYVPELEHGFFPKFSTEEMFNLVCPAPKLKGIGGIIRPILGF